MSSPQVSFDDEQLILVDRAGHVVGYADKASAHDGPGKLHRAFSVFLFNEAGELLLQQRSADKRLWPLYWSNSVCSHPRRGEETPAAAVRRVREELGLAPSLTYLYEFIYQAAFEDAGSEHELCAVFVGRADGEPRVNEREIAAWRFVAPEALDRELAASPTSFTPWLKLEWATLRREHWPAVLGAGN
jgi:isopentenyl-diphosphate Delta-isomerase